jgi:hypothetical protein
MSNASPLVSAEQKLVVVHPSHSCAGEMGDTDRYGV